MRLFIVGATGGIGEQLVEQALAGGHHVTALVRSPEKIGRVHDRLTIVVGDPLDAKQLRRALPEHDVVLSAIGPSPRPRASLASISILPKNLSAGNGHGGAFVGRWFFHDTVKDVAEMERMIVGSSLNWTIVRPPGLTDGSRTEHYRIKDSHLPGFGFKVSRADVAHFMLGEVQASRHLRKVVGVCY